MFDRKSVGENGGRLPSRSGVCGPDAEQFSRVCDQEKDSPSKALLLPRHPCLLCACLPGKEVLGAQEFLFQKMVSY